MKAFTVQENTTLRRFTDEHYAQASFVFRTLLKGKGIRVNGQRINRDVLLKRGDEVCYFLTPAQEKKTAFSVLYEDGNVVAVDKESGVNAEAVFSALAEKGETYFLHRLDRNTEGVMLFAKTQSAADELLACFREKRTEKIYLAAVAGHMPREHAVEEAYLKKDKSAAVVHVGRAPQGEKIRTEYEVLSQNASFSLLRVTLHTGKTHQIRAHLAFLGHPVLGDEKYGDAALNHALGMTRQRLISKQLTLFPVGEMAYLSGKSFVSPKNLQLPPENA